MKDYRRSQLQVRILLQLEEQKAKSITELADRIDAQRPSVSRSIRTLREQGLVDRNRQVWSLTEAGKVEASIEREKVADMTEEFASVVEGIRADMLVKTINPDFYKSLAVLANNPAARIAKQMNETVGFLNAIGEQVQLSSQVIAQTTNPLLTSGFYEKTIKPLYELQEQNNTIFQKLIANVTSPAFEALANQNNLYMANTINDIVKIRHDVIAHMTENFSKIDFTWLAKDLANINQAYSNLFTEQANKLEIFSSFTSAMQATSEIMLPTATISFYANSARNLVEAETQGDNFVLPEKGQGAFGDESLDQLLYELNPEFVEMRQGSWSALDAAGPDRLRHAATSQRELINQLLEFFASNAVLPKENQNGPQIKARLRIALRASKSDVEFVDKITKAVMSFYSQLSKYTHLNKKHEESLIALLQTGEGLIRFILVLAQREIADE